MGEWKTFVASDFIEFNPKESLKKGIIAPKISMDALDPFTRKIASYVNEAYNGGTKFRNQDTIMARITPCLENGKTSMVDILPNDVIGFGSTEYIVFRAKPGISDSKFVYYLACSKIIRDVAIKSMVGSSGRQRVQQSVVNNIEFSAPDLDEQEKIASILSKLDDKIELNRAINENLEQQAQALFKFWFVDFEPFDGIIPNNWIIGTVGDIIELYDSQRKPISGNVRDKMEKLYPYYGATSLMDYVDNYLFDGKYLLLGEDGTVVDDNGYPILQYIWGKFWVNNHAHIMSGKNGYNVESLYLFFKQTNVKSIVTGAVQLKINQANLRSIEALIPSKEVMIEFNNLIEPIFSIMRNNKNENDRLTSLRDSLLPKLMSGEIDVSGITI